MKIKPMKIKLIATFLSLFAAGAALADGEEQITVTADPGVEVTCSPSEFAVGTTNEVTIGVRETTGRFVCWEGSAVPDRHRFATNFTLTVSEGFAIRAVAATNVLYAAADGAGDGSSWADAAAPQVALDRARATSGSMVCFKEGDYSLSAQLRVTNTVAPVLVSGGYAGSGFEKGGETVFARPTSVKLRILYANAASCAFEGIVFSNGCHGVAKYGYGNGVLCESACVVEFRDCAFRRNRTVDIPWDAYLYGGAIATTGGSLTARNCAFSENSTYGSCMFGGGGAIWAKDASVFLFGCSFDKCFAATPNSREARGGCLSIESAARVEIANCSFTGNYIYNSNELYRDYRGSGGVLTFKTCPDVSISDSTFDGNWSGFVSTSYPKYPTGGTLLANNSKVRVLRTVVKNAGRNSNTYACGGLDVCNGGTLALTNVLFAGSYAGWAVGNCDSAVLAKNCTFAGLEHHNWALRTAAAYTAYPSGNATATASFENCILWNNAGGDTDVSDAPEPTFASCLTASAHTGFGNRYDVDPLFDDAVYYHPRSAAGTYTNGYFSGGGWSTTNSVTSPAVDYVKARLASLATEPQPNGYRVNCGYDGDAATASKSVVADPPAIDPFATGVVAYDEVSLSGDDFVFAGDLTGTNAASVTFVWGTVDAGETTDWQHAVDCGVRSPWDGISIAVAGPVSGAIHYAFVANYGSPDAVWSNIRVRAEPARPTLAYAATPLTFRYRTSVRVNLNLASDGGLDTTLDVVYALATNAAVVVTNAVLGGSVVEAGEIYADVGGLAPDTAYVFTAVARNALGETATSALGFTTPAVTEVRAAAEASGLGDGSSWSDTMAFAKALEQFTGEGEEILLREGAYFVNENVSGTQLANRHLTIRGGYGADGEPHAGETILTATNATQKTGRHFKFTGCTVTLDGLTLSDGHIGIDRYGQSIGSYSTTLTITNCLFRNNYNTDSPWDSAYYGGAIGASGGTLTVRGSRFRNNYLTGGIVPGGGGAIFATGATVFLSDTVFDGNHHYSKDYQRDSRGGVLAFESAPKVEIAGCAISNGYLYIGISSTSYATSGGGAISFRSCPDAVVRDTLFDGNYCYLGYGSYPRWTTGGTLLANNSNVRLERCVVRNAGRHTGIYSCGGVDLYSGTLALTNVLFANSYAGWAVGQKGGTLTARNCTFTGLEQHNWASRTAPAYMAYHTDSESPAVSASFADCIFWNNAGGDLDVAANQTPVIEYCLTQTEEPGTGNRHGVDPQFETTHFHPFSQAGRYEGGYFSGGEWVNTDTVTSVAVDFRKTRLASLATEPQPNGYRVNCGYDGGSAVASKSVVAEPPAFEPEAVGIVAYDEVTLDGDETTFYGDVTQSGSAHVYLVYGAANAGKTSIDAWEHSVDCGVHTAWDNARAVVTNAISGHVYYHFVADVGGGTLKWSSPIREYTAITPPTLAYADPVHTHLYRTSARVNVNLVDDGGADTTATIAYYPTDTPAAEVTVDVQSGSVLAEGAFYAALSDLEPGTSYTYVVTARNSAGETSLPAGTFTTPTEVAYYADAEAKGIGDGSSMANAMAIATAMSLAAEEGTEVRLREGAYCINEYLSGTTLANRRLTLRGGYGAGGERGAGETLFVATNATQKTGRHFRLSNCTVVFDSITFADGHIGADRYGQSIGSYSTTLTITNCLFRNNYNTDSPWDSAYYGGAIGASGGTLTVRGSRFRNNYLTGGIVPGGGGAIFASGATVFLSDTVFDGNHHYSRDYQRDSRGGVLAFESAPKVEIAGCAISNGYLYIGISSTSYATSGGGAISFRSCPDAVVRDTLFDGNYCYLGYGSYPRWTTGGTLLANNSNVRLERCVVRNAGRHTGTYSCGGVDLYSGTLALTNVLFANSYAGWAVGQKGGTLMARNCTFTGLEQHNWASRTAPAYMAYHTDSESPAVSASFADCIFWNNAGGDIDVAASQMPVIEYCLTQTEEAGVGNDFNVDPLFEDATWCHPRSAAGNYAGGYFDGGVWVTTNTVTSKAVDFNRARLASLATEPQPNGYRVNCGYDGGSATASKSVVAEPPVVDESALGVVAYGEVAVAGGLKTFYGDVTGSSAEPKEVIFVWGSTDGGTSTTNAWEHAASCQTHLPWDGLAAELIGAVEGTIRYRFVVAYGTAEATWSNPVRVFSEPTAPTLAFGSPDFTFVYRKSARVNLNLVSDGGLDTTARVVCWPTGDPSSAVTNLVKSGSVLAAGACYAEFSGLEPNASYTVRAYAENARGGVATEERVFATADLAEIRAAAEASGIGDGSSWADAMAFGDALALASGEKEEILLRAGAYCVNEYVSGTTLANRHLVIRGGYGASGERGAGETLFVATNATQKTGRHFRLNACTALFDSITFADGCLGSDNYGCSIRMLGATDLTVTNCTFRHNRNSDSPNSPWDATSYGGAIGATGGGSLTVLGCRFEKNWVTGGCLTGGAGAIYASATSVRVCDTLFATNYAYCLNKRDCRGGALRIDSAQEVEIANCVFNGNYLTTGSELASDYTGKGGVLCFSSCPDVTVRDSLFDGNWTSWVSTGKPKFPTGGTLLANSSKVRVLRTVVKRAGRNSNTYACGGIDVCGGGTLALTNCLFAENYAGWAIANAASAVSAANCTFANLTNRNSSVRPAATYVGYDADAKATFVNCISWGTPDGFDGNTNVVSTIGLSHDDLEGVAPDPSRHIISTDPKFVGEGVGGGAATFLSLQAKAYELKKNSPCLNAGDNLNYTSADTDLAGNPRVRNGNVDLGCFEGVKRGFAIIVK